MSERKVLNKYYPPDFDPNKIPKLKIKRTGVFNIRVMAPCNMRCNNCGEYIYKGKKFNSRKENVDDEFYLGLRIFRFYIKCPRCVSEIAFKTDLKNTDYTLEAGATRNFEAAKTAEAMARQEIQDKEDEERNNPMKVLENRTLASQREMEQIELLEELQDINMTKANVDHGQLLERQKEFLEKQLQQQEQEMEDEVRSIFGRTDANESVKRLRDSDSDDGDDDNVQSLKKPQLSKITKASDILTQEAPAAVKVKKPEVWEKSIGTSSSQKGLAGLIKKKMNGNALNKNGPSATSELELGEDLSTETSPQKSNGVAGDVPKENNKLPQSGSNSAPSALGLLAGYSGSESDSDPG